MLSRRNLLKTGIGLGVATLLAVSPARAANLEEVTYLLPAPPTMAAFGPWVLAQARGYYAQEGLNVNFVMAKGGVDVAKQVGAGNAPIGGAIGDTPIIARANGIPVKAVAVLGGRSLTQLVWHDGRGINSPKDLKGKVVTTLAYQDTTFYSLLGMLATSGLTKNDLDIQAAGPAGVWQLFAAGKADAMAAVPDWTIAAHQAGAKLKVHSSDEYFKSMAQAILASDETIRKRPDLVRKLVKATLRGMQDIMKDPKAAARDFVNAVPAQKGKEATIEQIFEMYSNYVYAGQKVLGAM
ncbi:MAG: ABC transporter substrate-binding protein, partial [Deltaproteobacteria bacterium]|nr:ABC transporter substrate-binding protein [Deltaproteobacteria bacterium]